MKKSIYQIAVTAMLLLMGCSKEELISNTNEDKQLKQGLWQGMSFESVSKQDGQFYPNPVYLTMSETDVRTYKILKNGSFYGSIQGKGKINQNLSYYNISSLIEMPNGIYPLNSAQKYYYELTASGKIFITEKDYCLADITGVTITPNYYTSGSIPGTTNDWYGFYINNGTGKIALHDGQGKLKGFSATLFVTRGNFYDNNLITGQLQLTYQEH